jgi:hypothetical protein
LFWCWVNARRYLRRCAQPASRPLKRCASSQAETLSRRATLIEDFKDQDNLVGTTNCQPSDRNDALTSKFDHFLNSRDLERELPVR